MRLELMIDDLILHEISAHQRQRITATLERELARLITEQGSPCAEQRLWLETLPVIEIDTRLKSEQIGAAVAQKIYGLLKERRGHK